VPLTAWIDGIVDATPEMDRYYPFDELVARAQHLAEQHPDVVRFEIIGHSRQDRAIPMLTVGTGPVNAFFMGCPHPNEPIGAQMVDTLAYLLVERKDLRERYPVTWSLVPCIDPDGTVLNEGWFDNPSSLLTYARHFYRPPSLEQVEWTFPFEGDGYSFNGPLPETAAAATVITRLKPEIFYSLHNCGFGGVYYYLSRPVPAIHDRLRNLAIERDLPLALGEPETQWGTKLDDAVLRSLSQHDHIAHVRRFGGDDAVATLITGGGSSYDFAVATVPDVAHLLTEVPYFLVEGIADQRLSGMTRGEVFTRALERSVAFQAALDEWWSRLSGTLAGDGPFHSLVREVRKHLPKSIEMTRSMIAGDPDMSREATVAERANALYVDGGYLMLTLGMVPRMMTAELDATGDDPDRLATLRQIQDEASTMVERWHDELDASAHYTAVPVRTLVPIELAAGLYLIDHLTAK
jgi:hypothetical protein